MTENIFREAKELLEKKGAGTQLCEEEQKLVGAALIPLNQLKGFKDMSISEGLEELAVMVEGSSGTEHRT